MNEGKNIFYENEMLFKCFSSWLTNENSSRRNKLGRAKSLMTGWYKTRFKSHGGKNHSTEGATNFGFKLSDS